MDALVEARRQWWAPPERQVTPAENFYWFLQKMRERGHVIARMAADVDDPHDWRITWEDGSTTHIIIP